MAALWWLGAGLLVSGSVIIGRREDGADTNETENANKGANEPEQKATQLNADSTRGTSTSTTNARSSTPNTEATRRSPRLNR
jgi:hypothetical protein